jgi:hypothetical protein
LVRSGEAFRLPLERLASRCDLFTNGGAVVAESGAVPSSVLQRIFRDFMDELNKKAAKISNEKIKGRSLLRVEIGLRARSPGGL